MLHCNIHFVDGSFDCKDCRHFSSALVKLPIMFEANFLPYGMKAILD